MSLTKKHSSNYLSSRSFCDDIPKKKPTNFVSELIIGNLGIPELLDDTPKEAQEWLKRVKSLKGEISDNRLYELSRASLKGKIAHWFNAFEGEEFSNLEGLLSFFERDFMVTEEKDDVKIWEILVKGPWGRDLLEVAYEIKSLNKKSIVRFDIIRDYFKKWVSFGIKEKIAEAADWKKLIAVLREYQEDKRQGECFPGLFGSSPFNKQTKLSPNPYAGRNPIFSMAPPKNKTEKAHDDAPLPFFK